MSTSPNREHKQHMLDMSVQQYLDMHSAQLEARLNEQHAALAAAIRAYYDTQKRLIRAQYDDAIADLRRQLSAPKR